MATKYLFAAMTARTDDPIAKLILIYLADAANENGFCWPSHSTIAAGCECSRSTVRRKIDELIAAGFIEYDNRANHGYKTSNMYRMLAPDAIRSNGKPRMAQPEPSSTRMAQPEPTDGPQRTIEPINNLSLKPSLKGGRFIPPTVEQVTNYCREYGCTVDPEQFVDFYASKDWMVGKNKMKDYRAAIRTWARRDQAKQQAGTTSTRRTSLRQDLEDTSWAK